MRHLFLLGALALLASCGGGQSHDHHEGEETTTVIENVSYGEAFEVNNVMSIEDVAAALDSVGMVDCVVKANIVETCAKMGCWMSVEQSNGEPVMVFMNDHSFFVPKEGMGGKTAYIKATASKDTTSVDILKHLAEDANAPQEEIDAITEPKYGMKLDATGVVIEGVEVTKEGASSMSEAAHDAVDHAHDVAHDAVDHVHEAAESVEETAKDMASDALDATENVVNEAGEAINKAQEAVK